MSDEQEAQGEAPMDPGEGLYRRLKRGWVACMASGDLRVLPEAFEPRDEDENGLSVFRALVMPASAAATVGLEGKGQYGVGAILSDAFFALELTLVTDNEPEGHVSCPEINPGMDGADEERWTTALAEECEVEGWYRVPGGERMAMPEFQPISE